MNVVDVRGGSGGAGHDRMSWRACEAVDGGGVDRWRLSCCRRLSVVEQDWSQSLSALPPIIWPACRTHFILCPFSVPVPVHGGERE